jgi:hypothetical protein
MTTCTICGGKVYGSDDTTLSMCDECYALNMAGNLLDFIPTSAPASEPATTSLLLQAVVRAQDESAAFAAWVEEHRRDPPPGAYIPYNPRQWSPTHGGMPPTDP